MSEESLETIELELAIMIRRITSYSSHKRIGNLDRSAYLLLHQIATNGPAGVKTLAGQSQLDISTISRQASALEQKGCLYRIPDPTDGRAYFLEITDLGLRKLREERQARKIRVGEVTKDWSDEERAMFGKLLTRFNIAAIQE